MQRWFFSSAFEPVRRWAFEGASTAVAEHLKNCPFNVKRKLPKKYPRTEEWDGLMRSLKHDVRFRSRS